MMYSDEGQQGVSLAAVLAGICFVDPKWDRYITGITTDSRAVGAGNLFIACVGLQQDGRKYIADAINAGAIAVIADAHDGFSATDTSEIPIFIAENLSQNVSKIASRFYQNPSRTLNVIGITGTNGKTSCSYFLAEIFAQNNQSCGLIGTLGYGTSQQLTAGNHTTPDAVALQKMLAEFRDKNINNVAMEVSSHALDQGRVNGVEFTTAVFTNLTRDHLDYHGDMQHYSEAKQKLFEQFGLHHAVINIDDTFGRVLLEKLKPEVKAFTFSCENSEADIYASGINFNSTGVTAKVHTPWGEAQLVSGLLGRFNLSNLLAVLTVLCIHGFTLEDAVTAIKELRGVPGRMQAFGGSQQPLIVVDYAHTPDALQKALQALRDHSQKMVTCVFGCGGDRDRGKRADMAKVAEENSDRIFVTSDNPRTEDPQQILNDIVSHLAKPDKAHIEIDRKIAIQQAISQANNDDIVLIAGKGHEDYQIIGETKYPFSDAEVAIEALKSSH